MNMAEGHILKKTRQANQQSEQALRKQHKAPTRSVIKNECGRRPHSQKDQASKSTVRWGWAFGRQHKAPTRSVFKKTMQAIQKSEESPIKQNKAPARSVIKNTKPQQGV